MSSKKASHNRGLCPVKDKNLVFVVVLGPEISFRACLWVLQGPCHITKCWLSTQCCIVPKDDWGPTDVLFSHKPACPGTKYTPTMCQV